MPIEFIYTEYKKDPTRIEKLLNQKLEIVEKLAGSRFLMQKTEDELSFFKSKDAKLSKIDRTLSKYYEKAIIHFDNLDEEKLLQFPDNWRFGFEYFPTSKPVTVSYDRLPLNNLILTDIQVKDPKNKTIDVITDKKTLQHWAEILEVENTLIIFEGELSESQKRKLLDFLNTPFSDLIKRFKTESFTSFLLNLLNPELKTSFLNNDLEKDIDGLIFKFNGKEALKVSNPEVISRKQEKKLEKPSDIYNLTLVFLQEFLTMTDFRKIKLKELSYEDRYIEFICQVYNKFLSTSTYRKNFQDGIDFELPSFLTRSESSSNFKFVRNIETLDNLDKSNTNRELFKILLASMRSHKKKPSGYLTKELIYNHNELVDKIADYISGEIQESVLCSFDEFKSVYLSESNDWQDEFGIEKSELSEINLMFENTEIPSFSEIKTSSRPINLIHTSPLDTLKKMYNSDNKKSNKKKTPVCIMKGKFHPFHNGHSSIIEDATNLSGMKIYLVILNKRISDEDKFSESLHTSMLDDILKSNKNIKGYVFSNGRSIAEICRDLPENISCESYAGNNDECEDIQIQMGEDFKTYPMTRHISSKTVLQAVRDDNYDSYRKLVPDVLHNYFYKIKSELK